MEAWREELYHYGVAGMQWGKRRWQNEDGSLTPAGRIHYGYDPETRTANGGDVNQVWSDYMKDMYSNINSNYNFPYDSKDEFEAELGELGIDTSKYTKSQIDSMYKQAGEIAKKEKEKAASNNSQKRAEEKKKAVDKYIKQRMQQYANLREALDDAYEGKGKKKYKTGRKEALEQLNEKYADVYEEAKKKLGIGKNAL